MESQLDIISPLAALQTNALSRVSPLTGEPSDFVQGYLMAISHAIQLAEVHQRRIDLRWPFQEARRHQEGK